MGKTYSQQPTGKNKPTVKNKPKHKKMEAYVRTKKI